MLTDLAQNESEKKQYLAALGLISKWTGVSIQNIELAIKISKSRMPTKVTDQLNLVQQVNDYIELNYDDPDLSLEMMAKHFYVSSCHLSRVYKEFAGKGFKDRVIGVRIDKAKQLLEKGQGVTHVCFAVGYGDVTHFGRMFKRVVGVNPSEYRKKAVAATTTA